MQTSFIPFRAMRKEERGILAAVHHAVLVKK